MIKLTKRQNSILFFISKNKKASTREIKNYLKEEEKLDLNRVTIIRELDKLLEKKVIQKKGQGRGVYYELADDSPLLNFLKIEDYFKISPDEREIKRLFDFEVFKIFYKKEPFFDYKNTINKIDKLNDEYNKRIKKLSPTLIKKEFERLNIELSWKSSQIEGNTYSLLETETLIKEHQEAQGRTKEETQMILNHKKTLDYIQSKKSDFKKLNLAKIENIHRLLVEKMDISCNIRKNLVGITGTNYRPLDNEFQIKEALEKMIEIANDKKIHPFLRAFAAILLISYIQPFEDGNKRTARLLGNAILMAHDYCPLSYRSVNENDYKKAMLYFYETNKIDFFKEIFVNQFVFSVNNYFLVKNYLKNN